MGENNNYNEKLIVDEYLKGKSSVMLEKELGIDKFKILAILKRHKVIRKRDRCNSIEIKEIDNLFIVDRVCPTCGGIAQTTSIYKTIACRNHFNSVNKNSDCRKCSLEKQKGEGNSFYGKKHTEKSKSKISESRKGKGMGENNAMANEETRKKLNKILLKKWENGEMEHLRNIFSKTMKETRRLGKIKSIIRSKKEDEIIDEIKNLGYEVKHSLRVDSKICDIYVPKFNLIIEYNGDYWHCNPEKYAADYFHTIKQKTAQELWDYDKNKIDLILENNYNLEIVWETDLKKNPQLIKQIIEKYESREQSNSKQQ